MFIFCSRPHFFSEKLFGGNFIFFARKYLDEIRQNSKELGKKSRFQESYASGEFWKNMIFGDFLDHIWQRRFFDANILFFDFFAQNPFGEHFLPIPVTWLLLQRLELFKNDVLGHLGWFFFVILVTCLALCPLNYTTKNALFTVFGKNWPFFPGVHF